MLKSFPVPVYCVQVATVMDVLAVLVDVMSVVGLCMGNSQPGRNVCNTPGNTRVVQIAACASVGNM